jgi:hypothetical protein
MLAQIAFLLYSAHKSPNGAKLSLGDFMLTKETPGAQPGPPGPPRRASLAAQLERYFLGG